MIVAEAKFNNGSGGVMVVITKETGRSTTGAGETKELGELLSPRQAIDFALLVLHKATDVPPELDTAIRALKDKERW